MPRFSFMRLAAAALVFALGSLPVASAQELLESTAAGSQRPLRPPPRTRTTPARGPSASPRRRG